MKNELVEKKETFINIFNEDYQNAIILGDLSKATTQEKLSFFNETLNCEDSASEHIGEKLEIKYIYICKQEILNDGGQVIDGKKTHSAPRMVFFTKDNKGIITFSSQVYTALKKINNVFGDPPYDFYIQFNTIERNKKRIFTINLVEKEGK